MSTNPYQTPEGQLTTDDLAYGEVKFFSPSSRINRLRYWAHSGLFSLAALVLLAIIGAISVFVSTTLGIVLGVVAYIGIIVFSFILIIQRLHDLNKTGWMSLLAIIPLANIYLIVLLIFFKGTEGRNNFGLQTPPNKTWHWIAALGIPAFVMVLGIVAAVALPAYQAYVGAAQGFESSYDAQDSDAYPSEYTEEGAIDDSAYSEEGVEESSSYESADESVDAQADESVDEVEAEVIESTEAETPQ
ncbi:MAG: DUF805 domain-containing protein [Cellvibrio sp.]|uniref:DUF805 domain-containing protein n=1 Tax=Cellvibrio sp. TaxID=1965322 RepID=UPI0031B4B15F